MVGWRPRPGAERGRRRRTRLLLSLAPLLPPRAAGGPAVRGVCWGDASKGGSCEGPDLTGLPRVASTWEAFVAWDGASGRKVCWGNKNYGGDCSGLNLTGATQVHSTAHAFVALNVDAGTAQCWGDPTEGGDCSGLNFTGITEVHSTRSAFLAYSRSDGRALCWGDPHRGGRCDGLNLLGFDEVQSSWGVFLARSAGGEVRCWGSDGIYGGPAAACAQAAALGGGVRRVAATPQAFVWQGRRPGTGGCWGDSAMGRCGPAQVEGATELHGNRYAFLAVDVASGVPHCWGMPRRGGSCPGLLLDGLQQVFSSWGVFLAANLSTGRHVCWGSDDTYYGGPASACRDLDFRGVTDVVTSPHAFVAFDRHSGRTLCWGEANWGGACPDLRGQRILSVHATRYAFLALVEDVREGAEPSRLHLWLWTTATFALSVVLVAVVWCLRCRRKRWDNSTPLHPKLERKVSRLRSRSGSFGGTSPHLANVFDNRAEKLLARAALQAAGGPANWGLTVQQLQDFHADYGPEIEDYRARHRVARDYRHVCMEDPCPCSHGYCSRRPFDPKQDELEALEILPLNMHLIVPLIIKPKTKGHLGIMGYWSLRNTLAPLKVQTFISHCWSCNFDGFMHAVATLGPETVVWVCSFSLPQNIDVNKVLGSRVLRSPFAEALTAAEQVCLVVDERVEALTRSWCCFELYLTVSHRIALDIRAPITSATTYQRILDRAARMDVRHCHASNEADHARILRVLRGAEDAVNRKVRQQVEQIVRLLAAAFNQPEAEYDLEADPAREGELSEGSGSTLRDAPTMSRYSI